MSMTISGVRERRAKAEIAISEILLRLCKETGLHVRRVEMRSTMVSLIGERTAEVAAVDATIVMENI